MTTRLFNIATAICVLCLVAMGAMFVTGYMPLEGRGDPEHERIFALFFGAVVGIGLVLNWAACFEPLIRYSEPRANGTPEPGSSTAISRKAE